MSTVTVSPKYQVVIPKAVRDQLGLSPGQKIQILACKDRIVLVPVLPAKRMRGAFKGIDTRVKREGDRV